MTSRTLGRGLILQNHKTAVALATSEKGKGLFAMQDFQRGEEVVAMNAHTLRKLSKKEWTSNVKTYGIPFDGAVYSTRLDKYVTDWSQGCIQQPRWHYMNHSSDPNLDMVSHPRGVIAWVANRFIPSGDELTFRYENAPASWDQ